MKSMEARSGKYGKEMLLRGDWEPKCAEILAESGIKSLILNNVAGWRGENTDFLNEVPFLEGLTIVNHHITDITGINALHNLVHLGINTYCKSEIDFTNFPHLKTLFLEWRPKATTLFQAKSLERLYINSFKTERWAELANLTQLRTLQIGNGSIRNVDFLKDFKFLTGLGLYLNRRLENLMGLEHLPSLEAISLSGSKKVGTLRSIGTLPKLKLLRLLNMGQIESLEPLKQSSLEELGLLCDTVLADQSLQPLLEMPKLKRVFIMKKAKYQPPYKSILRERMFSEERTYPELDWL